jgi:hypothetical protein
LNTIRLIVVLTIGVAVGACAGQPSQETIDKNLAVEDFIELRQLESLDKIRSDDGAGWKQITPTYIIYKTRRADYLFEFTRPCRELDDNTRIIADERFEANVIRARFETLRGCRIASIYALDEAEAAELGNIGDPPGSRN